MKIFGHRGAAGLKDENTLASVNEALQYKVTGIEIDVHRCKSGELIVIHDETVDRTTDQTGVVQEMTFDQLQQCKTPNGHAIPTLQQIVSISKGRCVLNIELKGKDTAKPVVSLIQKYVRSTHLWNYTNILISSFDHHMLHKVRQIDNEIAIGVLTETDIGESISTAEQLNARAIHPSIALLNPDEVSKAKRLELDINVWTVNTREQFEYCKDLGVTSVITDFPNLFV